MAGLALCQGHSSQFKIGQACRFRIGPVARLFRQLRYGVPLFIAAPVRGRFGVNQHQIRPARILTLGRVAGFGIGGRGNWGRPIILSDDWSSRTGGSRRGSRPFRKRGCRSGFVTCQLCCSRFEICLHRCDWVGIVIGISGLPSRLVHHQTRPARLLSL